MAEPFVEVDLEEIIRPWLYKLPFVVKIYSFEFCSL